MKEERKITVCGITSTVVISDEHEALLAASAAGRAVVGLWDRTARNQDLSPAAYLVECLEDADEAYLERVVRRKMGLPWIIGETDRLVIREFTIEDIPAIPVEEGDTEADRIFYTPEALEGYIRHQYSFYEYGIWALEEKETGILVGKAGVSHGEPEATGLGRCGRDCACLELGYHIFGPYRGRGYAGEACRRIQAYVKEIWNCGLYAKIDPSNEASIRLAKACGFRFTGKRYNEAGQCSFLYSWNC